MSVRPFVPRNVHPFSPVYRHTKAFTLRGSTSAERNTISRRLKYLPALLHIYGKTFSRDSRKNLPATRWKDRSRFRKKERISPTRCCQLERILLRSRTRCIFTPALRWLLRNEILHSSQSARYVRCFIRYSRRHCTNRLALFEIGSLLGFSPSLLTIVHLF